MIKKYRKKPVVMEALQFTGNNDVVCMEFVGKRLEKGQDRPDGLHGAQSDYIPYLLIPTLEGDMKCSQFDYIIKGIKGEFYPCKPEIFKATYEEVNSIKDDFSEFMANV